MAVVVVVLVVSVNTSSSSSSDASGGSSVSSSVTVENNNQKTIILGVLDICLPHERASRKQPARASARRYVLIVACSPQLLALLGISDFCQISENRRKFPQIVTGCTAANSAMVFGHFQ